MQYKLNFSTRLAAPQPRVWEWITSIDGISKEMAPYMRMTVPRGVTNIQSISFKPGKRLFRSWILLFGLIPFDFSDLTLESLDEGTGFVEQSPMGSMRLWRHERHLTPVEGGCLLTDNLTFEPRILGGLTFRIIKAFFTHRHRNLTRFFGLLPESKGTKE